jgi:probable HAF family extracellular repeat protein
VTGPPGNLRDSGAFGINGAGQAVGFQQLIVGGVNGDHAAEWSDGSFIDLGGLPDSIESDAESINDTGQVVGFSQFLPPPPPPPPPPPAVPEPTTWAMMLIGFAGLGFLGYRRAREQRAAV